MKKIKHIIKTIIFKLPFIKNLIIERDYLLEENKILKEIKLESNSLLEENRILKETKLKINNEIIKKDYELFF